MASCTAINRAEQTKTMKVNIDKAIIPNTLRAVSGLMPDSHPSFSSSSCSQGTAAIASTTLNEGRIQSELLK